MKKNLLFTLAALLLSVASFALPPITGIFGTCIGNMTTLIDSGATGGTWSSSNTSIATINSTSGAVYGVAAGTATITYTLGSSYVTAAFTVSAAPAAITGIPSSLCPGSTVTLSNATSGGTWSSSNMYVATIGAATGIATAVHSGTSTIYYTLGTGCSATATLTVASTSLTDSIYGSSYICAGSSTTFTIATTGGTWSSSNASVATVGAGSGVVTGVTAGSAIITYSVSGSCGTMTATKYVSVSASTSAGTITGTTAVNVGATTALHDAVTGGTWSSSATGIASINTSTGIVYGVSPGTATITYSVTGCGGTVTTTTTVTVSAFGGISGNVVLGSGSFYGNIKVWLITYNSSTMILQAVDSVMLTCSGTSAFYQFASPATDSYRVKAAVIDTFSSTTGYIPTYHDTSYYWYTANVINHTAGTADINKDIHMAYGTVTTGPGFIGGNVTTGANKGTSTSIPAVGLQMYAVNTTTNTMVQKVKTDASGNYSFSNLPVGQTYMIFPEALNYRTFAYTGINLTASAPSLTAASFVQHTVSKTITPIFVNVVTLANNDVTIAAYPNPVSSKLNILWSAATIENAAVTLSDITGNEIYRSTINMNGTGSTQIDLSGFANGLYIINVKGSALNYTNKVQVQH
jgi:uncharacterized protein YjdB